MRALLSISLSALLLGALGPQATSQQVPHSDQGPVQQPVRESAWLPLGAAPAALAPAEPWTLRAHLVAVPSGLLELLAERPWAASPFELSFELFGGEVLTSESLRVEVPGRDRLLLRARLRGGGHVSLARRGDAVAATLRRDGRLVRLVPAGPGVQRLVEFDESRFATCATDTLPLESEAAAPPAPPPGGWSASGGAAIDVMVVYTPKARQNQGGVAAIEALIDLAVLETNDAYANSQVTQRLRLVHTEELAGYAEHGDFGTELSRLRGRTDGYFDWVHATRDQVGADMVAMLVDSTQYCGIGYLLTSTAGQHDDIAFSVTSKTCATGYYSFAHELGHNMGSHHDRGNATAGVFPYSYGFRTPSGKYRTIMAYAPGSRIQYFSNPGVSHGGEALGVAHPSAQSAENWRSLNGTAAYVAQYRCAVPGAYGAAKTTSIGTQPVLSISGSPSVSGPGLGIDLSQGLPGKVGLVFYGGASAALPFKGGTLHVAPPLARLPLRQNGPGGSASFPFPFAGHAAGEVLFFQHWGRDPQHPDMTGSALSSGLRLELCP